MASTINRRMQDRHHRRIQVRFWIEGEERTYHGITNNISLHGAFIGCHRTFARGTRVRVELETAGSSVVLEGVVSHAHQVPPALRALGSSGMGVRFLNPDELLAPLVGGGTKTLRVSSNDGDGTPAPQVYPVVFETARKFLQCFRRDLINGGIFVHTSRPSGLQQAIGIEFHLPAPESRIVSARGRVVQVLEPRPTPTGNAAGGMGIELIDFERLLDELEPIVKRLEAITEGVEPPSPEAP